MHKTTIRLISKEVLDYIQCDVCKQEYKNDESNSLEIAEFTTIKFRGGYNSIFGDMSYVSIDICQHCLKEKLGEYLRISDI